MSGEAAEKSCCKCAVDVSKVKRHKDAKGRYWCEPCFAQAAMAAKAKGERAEAPAGAVAASSATPAWLAGSLAVEGKRCVSCSAPMPKDGVICTLCGHNLETGKAATTRVVAAPKEAKVKKAGVGFDPMMLIYGYGLICLGLLIGGTMNDACGMAFLIVAVIGTFAGSIWLIVAMAMQSVMKAVLGFLCGLYALYWVLTQCESQALRTLSVVNIMVAVVMGIAQAGVIPLPVLENMGATTGP